jgi:hypothetical protein
MKILKYLPDIISYFLLSLSIYGLFLAFRWVNSQLDDTLPDMNYQTIFLKDTLKVKEPPDMDVRWLEKIKYIEGKPVTVQPLIYDYPPPEYLIEWVEANGDSIITSTRKIKGDSLFKGERNTYLYYPYFTLYGKNQIKYHKNYFDWEKLFIQVSCDFSQITEIKLGSSIEYVPWRLYIEPYISNRKIEERTKMEVGVDLKKYFW